jgi:DNA-binding transcriptional regulator GbsR (MarR family)
MGTRWGVQRSMAEVHALLFIAGEPLSAEDIMDRLAISRGSVSTTLKQLVEWGLVQRVKPKGRTDRREYHQAEQDVWKLFYTILRARKRREFDPLIEQLDGCKIESGPASKSGAKSGAKSGRKSERERQHDQRIEELLALCVFFDGLANTISKSGKGIERATKILARVLGVAR